MNIAMVVYSHYSRDARVRRYTEALARKNHKIDIICLPETYQPSKKSIKLLHFPLDRTRSGLFWYFIEYTSFFLFSLIILTYQGIRKKYQIIHINNMPDFLVFTAAVPKLLGAKIILDMHDPMPELYASKFEVSQRHVIYGLLRILEKLSMNFADYVLTANYRFLDLFINRKSVAKNKISVILNCPDTRLFKFKQEKSKQINSFTLLYMGTIDRRFKLDIIIKAIPKLIKDIPEIKLILIPKITKEGEYFNELHKDIKKLGLESFVKIEKPMPLEQIVSVLKKSDIGIVLADKSLFTQLILPVKLLEFIQMRIPVIATKTETLSKYFTDQMIFYLKDNTTEELIQAIKYLKKNPHKRKELATNAYTYLKSNNWPNEEKKYLSLVKLVEKE